MLSGLFAKAHTQATGLLAKVSRVSETIIQYPTEVCRFYCRFLVHFVAGDDHGFFLGLHACTAVYILWSGSHNMVPLLSFSDGYVAM